MLSYNYPLAPSTLNSIRLTVLNFWQIVCEVQRTLCQIGYVEVKSRTIYEPYRVTAFSILKVIFRRNKRCASNIVSMSQTKVAAWNINGFKYTTMAAKCLIFDLSKKLVKFCINRALKQSPV